MCPILKFSSEAVNILIFQLTNELCISLELRKAKIFSTEVVTGPMSSFETEYLLGVPVYR